MRLFFSVKNICCCLAVAAISAFCFQANAIDLKLKDGTIYKDANILSKNQFGVQIFDRKDTQNGKDVQRFIPFSQMHASTLRLFPYCDNKTIDRLDNALRDRKELIEKKFKDRIQVYDQETNHALAFNGPTGVSSLRVFVIITDVLENGVIGWVYTDAQEAIFYGKVYIQDLAADVNDIWINDIYPVEDQPQITVNDIIYPCYTIYPRERGGFMNKDDAENGKGRRNRPPRGSGGGGGRHR